MAKTRIIVFGDLILDRYIKGSSSRLSPEAPIPVVMENEVSLVLGGAGNVARNLANFGVEVELISVVGKDEFVEVLEELLRSYGMVINSLVIDDNRPTTVKTRVIADGHQIVRIDRETTFPISSITEQNILANLKERPLDFDVIVISDYAKGMCTPYLVSGIIEYANSKNVKVIVDPKGRDFSKYRNAFCITPNRLEASVATGEKLDSQVSIESALIHFKESLEIEQPIITLGCEGIAFLYDNLKIFPAISQEIIDVTGAGDTVIASLAFQLSKGVSVSDAIIFANKAASIVVKKFGSATASLMEIAEIGNTSGNVSIDNKVLNKYGLSESINRLSGRKVVFTNVCFDLLHPGHVQYLYEASKLGDVLIVGVYSDKSIRRLKGIQRPILDETSRLLMLSALVFVDYVVIVDADTSLEILRKIRPELLIKGGDSKTYDILGTEYAKEVMTIPFIDEFNTTSLIQRIKSLV